MYHLSHYSFCVPRTRPRFLFVPFLLPQRMKSKLLFQNILNKNFVRFEGFMAMRIIIFFFWVLAPCCLVGSRQRFVEIYCLHLQVWSDDVTQHLLTSVQGAGTQKFMISRLCILLISAAFLYCFRWLKATRTRTWDRSGNWTRPCGPAESAFFRTATTGAQSAWGWKCTAATGMVRRSLRV